MPSKQKQPDIEYRPPKLRYTWDDYVFVIGLIGVILGLCYLIVAGVVFLMR